MRVCVTPARLCTWPAVLLRCISLNKSSLAPETEDVPVDLAIRSDPILSDPLPPLTLHVPGNRPATVDRRLVNQVVAHRCSAHCCSGRALLRFSCCAPLVLFFVLLSCCRAAGRRCNDAALTAAPYREPAPLPRLFRSHLRPVHPEARPRERAPHVLACEYVTSLAVACGTHVDRCVSVHCAPSRTNCHGHTTTPLPWSKLPPDCLVCCDCHSSLTIKCYLRNGQVRRASA